MAAVRAEVVELVFAGAVVAVFASALAALYGRIARSALVAIAGLTVAATVVAWVVFALQPARELAVAAGGLTVCAALQLLLLALARLVGRAQQVEERLEAAEQRFETLVSAEVGARAAELDRTLSRARADSLSKLVAEERRIADERRAAFEDRERKAGAELSEALGRVEQRVAHRLAELTTDLERTEQALVAQLTTLGQRQKQLMADAESRLALDTERLDGVSETQRDRLAALETQFERAAREAAEAAHEELETHERDRRRALHDVADRLRRRERELRERVAAEEAEAIQRIQAGFADIERRQLDQLKRVVERTADSFSEAVSNQFADAGGQRLERKLSQIGTSLEQERDELVAELQRRVGDAEVELRSQVQALAADAEAERTVLNARLQDLRRRIDEALSEAGSRLAPTFRGS